ncbi:MAG: dockerin type I repeat-containing protein [Clostridia bacterium]|nr:dockerin type I repeat-containing protein [Clostridia bacterium]
MKRTASFLLITALLTAVFALPLGVFAEDKITVEDQMNEALGEAYATAKVDYVIDAPDTYKIGDEINVTVSVKGITAPNGLHVVAFDLFYDNDQLLITNDLDEEDENALICIDELPSGWENLSTVANDYDPENVEGTTVNPINDGVAKISVFTAKSTASSAIKEDNALVFYFTFKVIKADGDIGIVIPHAKCEGAYNGKTGAEVFNANGSYSVIHQTEIMKGYDATCTEEGLTDGLYCPDCGIIHVKQETIPEKGHAKISHEAKSPTCTEIGWDAYDTCKRCDYTTYNELPSLGHNIVSHDAKDPTCTDIGWDAYEACTRCSYSTKDTIASLGHDKLHHDAKAPTCTEIGWDAYDTCKRCDYTTYKEKQEKGHDDGEWKTTVEPTLFDTGWAELHCTECDALLDEKELPALLILGDVNKNGEVEKYDYIAVKRAVMKTLELDEQQVIAADVNKNGEVEKYDYILIKRHVMGTYKIEG